MNENSILPLQIEALREDLIQIERTLNMLQLRDALPVSAGVRRDGIDVLERVRPRFDYLIQTQRVELAEVETKIKENRAPGECWKGLRNIRQECKKLFQACLALVEGALVRQHGLDSGLCRITDAMLDELNFMADAAWRRFTVWADGESFANLDEVIRVRFPSVNIWHLPVSAHEFGHFVSQNLTVPGTLRRPFAELCEDYKSSEEAPYLPEYFSDIFATYAVGPAYVCACVIMRFDHGAANFPSPRHPCDAKRVYAQLRTLEKMDNDSRGSYLPQYAYVRERLGDLWRLGLTAAFQQADLEESSAAELDEMLDGVYKIIANDLPPRVRYGGWLRAQRLSAVLRSGDARESKLEQLGADDTIIDVVNGAWLSRLLSENGQTGAHELSGNALALCDAILARRRDV